MKIKFEIYEYADGLSAYNGDKEGAKKIDEYTITTNSPSREINKLEAAHFGTHNFFKHEIL